MISLRILLIQGMFLWILDKARGRESCRFVVEGEAEPQLRQEGFGMLWEDTGGNSLLCPRAGPAGLDLGSEGLGTGRTSGTPGLGCHSLGAGEELHFSVESWEFTAVPLWFCPLLQLLGIQPRSWE